MARPTKYKPEMCETVIELMKDGASKCEVAAKLEIDESTLYAWTKENEEFSKTIKRGEQLSKAWWQERGRLELKNKDFSYTGWYMNMKNRFGWSDKQETKETDKFSIDDILNDIDGKDAGLPE